MCIFIFPPCKGRETLFFPLRLSVGLSFCLSVGLSVHHKIVSVYNLITLTDISTKLHTLVKHIETLCHAQEP